jgi:membrane-associated phospholipid phosphatase
MSLRSEKLLASIALGGGFYVIFQLVAAWATAHSRPAPAWMATPLDAALPAAAGSAWIYVSWYPASAIALLADRGTLRRFYLSYAVAFACCVPFYFLLPVSINRPAYDDPAGLSQRLLMALYAADPPVNLFPSFHAAVAAILVRIPFGGRVIRGARAAWMAAVCIACVLTKQHYAVDVVAGLGVGWLAVRGADALLAMRHLHVAIGRPSRRRRTRFPSIAS